MVARVRRREPLEEPPEVFARIDPAPQARPEQAVEHRAARSGPHVADEQVVLLPQCARPDRILDTVVVDGHGTVPEIH